MSRNAAVSGGSSGGRLTQVSATTSSVPKRTGWPIGAPKVEIRAVTLSRPCSTASSADAGRAPSSTAKARHTRRTVIRLGAALRTASLRLGAVRRRMLLLLVAEREHELAEQLHQVNRRLGEFQLAARLDHGVGRARHEVEELAAEQP